MNPPGPSDTICALASGAPPSAIGVIRCSGSGAPELLREMCGGLPEARRATLMDLRDPDGELIDHAIVLFMPGPASYTGEDSFELQVHGGAGIIEHALGALTRDGRARLAEPGEFTRRAFDAGKLDLLQAEAVADLIDAETRAQKDQALRQIDGGLSETYDGWRSAITETLALLEVAIDFPDEDDAPDDTGGEVIGRIEQIISDLKRAIGDGGLGERLRDGFRVAIVGRPNAGKSTLMNQIAGRDVAIVTDRAGTTRDVLEARLRIGGAIVWLIDTAGLREADDPIEIEGVRRAEIAARRADLRIHVLDGAQAGDGLSQDLFVDGDLVVLNKSDLGSVTSKPGALSVSARDGDGISNLMDALASWVARQTLRAEASVVTRARHRSAIESCIDRLESARSGFRGGIGSELIAEDMRLAARAIGGVVGDVGVEDVLGAVFSSFCIGK